MSHKSAPANQSADATQEVYYNVKSQDGKIFRVSELIIKQSDTLKDLCLGMVAGNHKPIPLDDINGKTLDLIFTWCEHHKGKPSIVHTDFKNVELSEFEQDLLYANQDILFDVLSAANYLNIEGLLGVCGKTVSDMAHEKPLEELRKLYVPTDEEKEAAAKKAQREATESAKNDAGEGPSTA